jgi:hypothetical protein
MVTIKRILPVALGVSLLGASCQNSETKEETTTDTVATVQHASLEMTAVSGSPEFPGASLTFGSATAAKQGEDSVKVSFTFNVKNYDLKSQTADAAGKQCNNSAQGQHIHFILDNKPYTALYEPKHEVVLAKNTEHHLLCFLSRSYHESLKNKEAAFVYSFKIDDKGNLQKTEVPKTPMVFYSRPKGDYLGKDTENLLFDFYVWNGSLSDSLKVKANVKGDGLDTTFMLTEWKANFLKNVPMGKPSITLILVDKDGNKINGPETEVMREFTLSKDEPIAAK